MLLHETFETQARRTPDRVAVLAGPAHLTYAELDRRADQLAGSLRRLRVGPEVRVGLCLARDLPLVTAILAVLKAGGVYVPLDPTYPTPRLALLLEDSGATVLLTQESLLPVLPAHAARVVQLDANRPWSDAATPPEDAAEGRSALPRNLAYLIYTSGSTGRPKSVAIAHESAVALVRWALSVFAAEELAGVLFSTSVCFDLSIFELFTPLAVGGSLVVAGNALDLPALPAAQAVTLVNTVPSAMAELVRRNGVPTSVQTVNLAGEALPGALAEAIYGTTAVDRVWNLYGPSESTTYSTFALVERGALGEPSIGRPIDGTRAYLLDEQGEPAGAGEAGEIVLGGAGLARGYLDRPDLTAERFTPDPLAVAPGERVYRTGDLGRPLPDGSLHCVGRVDQQVKVRGFRIELGEVEAALARHPALEEVAVAARAHSAAVAGDRRLVAYVVAASPPPTARQLRDFLLQSLPASMVPSVFVRLPALPRRPNGKLDRQLLPEPGAFRDDLAAAFSPPEGPIEERLAGLWAEVLGGERIGRDDDFFALGGHSLLATRLLSRVRDTLGADLPFGALFAAPTVADLAGRVEAALATAPSPLPPLLPPAPHPTRVPLAPGLFGMWFDARREPDLPLYNIAQAVILRGPLDPVALATALAALVCRHDALRTRFLEIDGQPVQEALPPSPPALPVLDLGSLPAADRIREAARLGRHEVRWRFDPASGKLLRAVLVRLAAAEHLLLRTVHHLVFDGLSEEIFWRELSVFYSAAIDAVDTAPPPDLPLGFADYAWWQHRWLGETLAGQVSWWRERLSDLAPLALPTDRPRPALESRRGGELRSLLPAPLVGDVRDVARRQGATPFMALLAAFSALLHRYSGQEDFAVGAPVAGRGPSALEGLIGCFVNLLPLRAGFAGRPTGGRLLTQTRETALAAFAQQDVPYARLVGELAGERDPNRAALVQVAFQLVGEVHPAPRLPGVIAVSAGLHNGTAKFDLDLELEERGEEIGVRCEYRLDLFDPPTVVRLLDHFARLTAALVASLGQPVIDLPLLSAAEAHQTLAEWNDTAVGRQDGAPEGPWVHEIFAEQAGWRPEALAVTAGGQVLSYGELDRRARRLAGALRGLGVGPEVRVGIGIERSPELVIAVLAVLQAGGAFVALDPTLPEERLGFQLEDSGAPVLLTRRGPLADRAAGLGIRCLFPHEPSVGASLGTLTTLQPDNLAYVIYTSGSTGRPKGVELCHGALANLIAWHRSTFAVTQNDRATLLAGVGFDAAVWETWPYLASGASLHVLPEAIRTAPEELRDWLITQGITVTWLPVPLAEAVLDLPWAPDGASRPALRCLLTGSDRLHRYPPTALPFPLLNTYGPTEGTVISTCGIVPAADSRSQERGAPGIGRPLDNVRVHVVDPLGGDLRPVPCGVPGELLIGGAGLARGYLCRPDLTAERFLPDPFAAPPLPPGERLYRTGDLVRWLPDGEIDFLGRIDHQVKIRGYRIELGEIESVLARHPAVREAVVLAPDGGIGGLVAFFTACENGAPPEAVELRDLLFRQLPEYMIPARFVPLAVLPLNASGKVDRQALTLLARQLGPVVGDAGDHEKAPRTPVEELLANLWEGILERSPIRTGDNFFDLGGHSLLVTRLLARIREVLGMSLPVQAVFEHPTLGALARAVETARPEAAETALPPLVPVVREGRLPLSFAQQRLWFLDRLAPGGATYNVPVAYALRGPLAPVALAASLTEVVRRHEALRTRFVEVDGAPWQEIEAPQPVPLALVDLGRLSSWRERQDAEVARLGRENVGRPFDLTRGPLLRARLVRLSAAEHALQLSVHHIAFDGWSAGLLRGELSALYAAHAAHAAGVERRLSPLPELPVQYADFAVWQRAWPPEVLAGQLAYWRRQLAGAPTALELPTDRPRPAVQSFRGAVRERCLPDELAALLRQAARREGVTLHMLLLAGFAALLSRYTEQEDLLIGTPVANRTRPEVFGLIGFFVNTLVLRARLSDAPDFRRLLVATRDSTLSAFAHQDLPFEALVEELKPERDLGRNPLIQVLLVLQSAGRAAEAWELRDGLRFTPLRPAESRTAKFDLSLAVEEQGETLALELEVAADLFTTSTAARLLGHYAALLAGAARNPDSPVARLPLLGKEERQQLAAEWNDTASAFPRRSLHRLFEAQAAARPEAVAVVWENGELTYGELDRRAGRIARALRRLGVGPEARVGLCFERSAEWVTAMLGILKAGGVYLPLDPTYPRERLDLLLQDAAPAVLVGIRPLLEKLPGTVPRLALEALETIPEVSGPEVEPEGLAYVLYTSGSTGMPKGVEICHQAVVRLVRKTGYAAFGPGEVFLQLAPLSFDAATLEIWGPLLNGGRLALFPPRPFSLAELEAAVARYGVTTLWLTAGLFHLAVDEGLAGFAGLRQLLAGGDVLSRGHVERALAQLPGVELINGYGPTENTTFSATHRLRRSLGEGSVPIGRPIANSRAYVLDRELELVPVGVVGELYVGGAGLARGYLQRPERTAERFIPAPFGGVGGGRLYRTGDRARWRVEGVLEFLGRRDFQVKIRGFRVELGEVESALLRHPGIREAVVTAGAESLVAYYVPAGDEVDVAELRTFLGQRLPEPLVPSAFVALAALPLSSNGKVDRRALPAPEEVPTAGGGAAVAPRTPVEAALAGIWEEVLGLDRIGIHDNFFHLGGHSLLALRVLSRLRATLGVTLPLQTLFASPTIAELAAELTAGVTESPGSDAPASPIQRVARDGGLPLSSSQLRQWFLVQLEPQATVYNLPLTLCLAGPLQHAPLSRSLDEIVRRQESLRTTFPAVRGRPVAVVGEARSLPLPEVDLGALPARERQAETRRLVQAEGERPFDLMRGPLLHTALLRLALEEHLLLLTLHHIVFDGWSFGVFTRELAALYAAFRAGLPSPLPALEIQYVDFAAWQQEWLAGEEAQAQADAWRARLAGAARVLDLPTDRPRPPVQSYRGAFVPVRLEPALAERLRALGLAEGATLFMTLLAGWSALLQRYTRQDDLLVGTFVANRRWAAVEPLLGFFVNTLVLRADLTGEPSLRALLARTRETTLWAYEHQDLPFETLLEALDVERDLSRTPLLQTHFGFQNFSVPTIELPGLAIAPVDLYEGGRANFDLTLALWETEGALSGWIQYNADLFLPTTAERMVRHFTGLLARAAGAPDQPLAELSPLTAAERHQALVEWSGEDVGDATRTVPEMFAAQAARTPEAVAVVAGTTALTYAELARRSTALAGRLRQLGVGPETVVGLCCPRSLEMIVGLFGILAAGGAYLPLDPALPPGRLALLVEDAGATALVTLARLAPGFVRFAGPVLCLEEAAGKPSELPGPDPGNLAYVLYTSGSTGRPKGVLIDHAALARFTGNAVAVHGVGPGDRVLQFASLAFDASCEEIYPCLAAGATLVLRDEAMLGSAALFLATCGDWSITLLDLPTAYWHTLVAELASGRGAVPASVRRVILGGERPQPGRLRAWFAAAGRRPQLLNSYGPTEATVVATAGRLEVQASGGAPIGQPLPGTRVWLLDRGGNPVPIGVPGELCIAGRGLARGYHGRPDLTAERFLPTSLAGPGARLYRTGDLLRHLPDGGMEFLGRLDDQVKIRGFRVEPEEVAAVLAGHPQVREAAVVAAPAASGDLRLLAYVVAGQEPGPPAGELREFLKERLPAYMVPADYLALPALPRTATGKLDRRALPAPEAGRDRTAVPAAPPETETEALLVEIWQHLLGRQPVGLYDNLFDLGAHSLLAPQFIAQVEEVFQLELPLHVLFESPTVKELAVAIQDALLTQIESLSDEEVAALVGADSP